MDRHNHGIIQVAVGTSVLAAHLPEVVNVR